MRYAGEAPLGSLSAKYRKAHLDQMHDQAEVMSSVRKLVAELVAHQPRVREGLELRDLESFVCIKEHLGHDKGAELRAELVKLRAAFATTEAGLADSVVECARLSATVSKLERDNAIPDMIASTTGGVHQPTLMGMRHELYHWRTKCGWKFGYSRYTIVDKLPLSSKLICDGCFPVEKSRARALEEDKVSDNEEDELASSDSSGPGSP